MNELQALGIFLVEVDAGNATVVYLSPELAEVGAPLVPHPCLGEQSACVAGLEDTDTEVDILAEAHLAEAAETFIYVTSNAHIERTGIEFIEFLLATTYTSGREKTCHGVGDSLLRVGKRVVCAVWTTESVDRFAA